MRYCEECEELVIEGDTPTCPACGKVMTAVNEMTPEELDKLVVLTTCETPYEAKVLRAALSGEGIDAIIEDEGLLETINPFHAGADAEGSSRVLVRIADAEGALDLLTRKESGELAIDEDDMPEGGEEFADDEE